jgi:hypothetical protein
VVVGAQQTVLVVLEILLAQAHLKGIMVVMGLVLCDLEVVGVVALVLLAQLLHQPPVEMVEMERHRLFQVLQ